MSSNSSPHIIYMGTPEFAVEPLRAILAAGYNVVAVVTVPDKPAGRGLKIQQSPVKKFANQMGIPVLQPSKLKDPKFIDTLKSLKPDVAVIVAFRMLPAEVWRLPKKGTFNLHASLLPQYRGAAPINWAIINGETETGLTTFLLDHQIDTGHILLQKRIPIGETEIAGELHDKMMLEGAQLVTETINLLWKGNYNAIPQEQIPLQGKIKPAPKIFKETCRISWKEPVIKVYNLIRGLSPHPAAWCELKIRRNSEESDIILKIIRAEIVKSNLASKPGEIATNGKTYLHVSCADGWLSLHSIHQAGKKVMQIDEFLRGLQNIEIVKML